MTRLSTSGPFFFALAVAGLKAYFLARRIEPDAWSGLFAPILLADLESIAVVLILCGLGAVVGQPRARAVLVVLAALSALYYGADTAVVLKADWHLTPAAALMFAPDWKLAAHFLTIWDAVIVPALFLLWRFSPRVSRRSGGLAAAAAAALFALSLGYFRPLPVAERYAFSFGFLLPSGSGPDAPKLRFSDAEVRWYAERRRPPMTFPPGLDAPDIVLLVVEGLSSIDLKRVSGVKDRLPRLDRIAEDGILFTNFFANYSASAGGIVALISGVPPLPFPGSTRNIMLSFAEQPSVAGFLRRRGYYTEALNTWPMDFQQTGHFYKRTGFEAVLGAAEVPEFSSSPSYSMGAAPDAILYDVFLSRWDARAGRPEPKFYFVFADSSHPPWIDPLGRGDTEDNVWDYVDQQLSRLYEELKRRNFFENGILLITGDHRKMWPVGHEEFERFGEGSWARVPLIAIGAGLAKGRLDGRFFQQADLFPRLADLGRPEVPLSPFAIFVARYDDWNSGNADKGPFKVFVPDDEGRRGIPGAVSGRDVVWTKERPPRFAELETAIRSQQALAQYFRDEGRRMCEFSPSAEVRPAAEGRRGLRAAIYYGVEIRVDPDMPEGRLIRRFSAPRIDYPNMKQLAEGGPEFGFAVKFDGFLKVSRAGYHAFRIESDDGVCLGIDGSVVVDGNEDTPAAVTEGEVRLSKGLHRIELRYFQGTGDARLRLFWKPPGAREFAILPEEALMLPAEKTD